MDSIIAGAACVLVGIYAGGHLTDELPFKIGDGDIKVPPRQHGSDLTSVIREDVATNVTVEQVIHSCTRPLCVGANRAARQVLLLPCHCEDTRVRLRGCHVPLSFLESPDDCMYSV